MKKPGRIGLASCLAAFLALACLPAFAAGADLPSEAAPASLSAQTPQDSLPRPSPPDSLTVHSPMDSLPPARFPADSLKQVPPPPDSLRSSPPPTQAASPAIEIAPLPGDEPRPAPTAIGVYAGSPSFVGAQIVAPVDGSVGFRSGLTSLPGLGLLWTPGVEVRFGQEEGTYGHDGAYAFGEFFFARTYPGKDREHVRGDLGLGYRWLLSDYREGMRWVAGGEIGGQWQKGSAWPQRPHLRVYWMFAWK